MGVTQVCTFIPIVIDVGSSEVLREWTIYGDGLKSVETIDEM